MTLSSLNLVATGSSHNGFRAYLWHTGNYQYSIDIDRSANFTLYDTSFDDAVSSFRDLVGDTFNLVSI